MKPLKDSGKPVIGCLPLYPPQELLHSMGLTPVVLWGLRDSVGHTHDADAHLQKYVCSVARHLAQFVMAAGADQLDGLLYYNACDTLRNLPEILREGMGERGRGFPFFRLHVPMTSAAAGGDLLRQELGELIGALEAAYGTSFSEESFARSVALYRRASELSVRLEEAAREGRLSIREFCGTLVGAVFMTVEDRIAALEGALERAAEAPPVRREPAVILSGIMAPLRQVCDFLDEAGLGLAGNDVAMLRRSYGCEPFEWSDVAGYYARYYREHHPCTTLLHTADRRLAEVERLAGSADGLIFIGEKFCEYEYFELPLLQERLKLAGMPVLALEFSLDDDENLESYRTRIEAFAELLREGRAAPERPGGERVDA